MKRFCRSWLALCLGALGLASGPATAARLEVSQGHSLSAALARADPGDVIDVLAGVYAGPLVVDRAVELVGHGWPVIDGGGVGTVVSIRAADVRIEGFVIRGSGSSLDQESSGIKLDAPSGRIVGNRLKEVLFGIYLRQAPGSEVLNNEIRGKDLPVPRRGDAIRIWSSRGVRLEGNRVEAGRDVVLWYSADLSVLDNRVTDGRYGLHFMYCDDARIERNLLSANSVGAFLMYSRRLRFVANTVLGNHGPSGYGIGLKDMDDALVTGNVFAGNRVGAFLDNSPRESESAVEISGNLFAANDIGMELMPNVERGRFTTNSFVDNQQQVSIAGGGGRPEANLWHANHWSDYIGFDADGDGVGDLPMRADELFESLADRKPELRFFLWSPASEALELAAEAFPLVRPRPKLVDEAPQMSYTLPLGVPSLERSDGDGWLHLGGGLLLGALLVLVAPMIRGPGPPSTQRPGAEPLAEPILEVEGLSKRFGRRMALDNVCFRVAQGEVLALWGPNGAGKTTALRALLGVIPVQGRVRLGGFDPARDGKQARRLVGFVPQEVQLASDWRVLETLKFFASLRRAPLERIDLLIAELGLEAETTKRVGELSGGLRQRLALALALLSDPPILLLDEPTANLDAAARQHFLELLLRLKEGGKTLVFSSHRPEEVLALADRVLHLEAGRAIADAPTLAFPLFGLPSAPDETHDGPRDSCPRHDCPLRAAARRGEPHAP